VSTLTASAVSDTTAVTILWTCLIYAAATSAWNIRAEILDQLDAHRARTRAGAR
jgi:hypothetical protein